MHVICSLIYDGVMPPPPVAYASCVRALGKDRQGQGRDRDSLQHEVRSSPLLCEPLN